MRVMGLRARLALFFVAITVVPLTVALSMLQMQIARELEAREHAELTSVRGAATALLEEARERAGDLATDLVARGAGPVLDGADEAQAQQWLSEQAADSFEGRADVIVLAGVDGAVLAQLSRDPTFASGVHAPTPAELVAAAQRQTVPAGVFLEVREVHGAVVGGPERPLGWVITGLWMDDSLLRRMPLAGGSGFAVDGLVLSAIGAAPGDITPRELPPAGEVAPTTIGGQEVLTTVAGLDRRVGADAGAVLFLWAAPAQGVGGAGGLAAALLIPSVLIAGVLGWLIAGGFVAPVSEAAEVAHAVAAGDLKRELEPRGARELRQLAVALNRMSKELATRLDEVEQSRDQLRGSLVRLGQTLSTSLDLNRTLAVVVETAMQTLGADRGALLMLTPERDALYMKVGRGITSPTQVRVGEGISGHVVETGKAIRIPPEPGTEVPEPAPSEPVGVQQLAVPLQGRGRVIGVLVLIRDEPEAPFSNDDLDTIRSFSAQISVAIENVMLHQEAQRLSVTDSLTGLWNFRYFQLQAERELESSSRSERPTSLIIVDIDHFKPVNDRYGHQVGDEVLIIVAARLREATRAPDVVARYGGEEFVVLLPGTGLDGALTTAERIRATIGGTAIPVTGADVDSLLITCSVGVATFPSHGRSMASLLRSADAAMYQAKTQGRNRVMAAEHAVRQTEEVEG